MLQFPYNVCINVHKITVMRYLLALLVILVSCSSDPVSQKEKEYPYITGTWYVESPEYARWIGGSANKAKSRADTTVFTSPGQNELEIEADVTIFNGVTFIVSDTSINQSDSIFTASTSVKLPDSAFVPIGDSPHWGKSANYRYGYLQTSFNLSRNCDVMSDSSSIFVTLYADSGKTVFKTYEFKTDGFLKATHDLGRCD